MSRSWKLPSDLGQPLNQVFGQWWKRLGDRTLALAEFRRALLERRLVAVRYEEGKPLRMEPPTYWRKARLEFDRKEPLCVEVVEGDGVPIQADFYISEPAGNGRESKNILPAKDTTAAAPVQDLKAPKKRGRRRDHPWDKIRLETVRRVFNNGHPAWPESENKLAGDIEQWCLERFKKAPAISELRAMVADVVKGLRALLS
jgi:hypothetical protein